MLRILLILVTAAACVGGGATAGLAAFANVSSWPLSGPNFTEAACLGATCGAIGAVIAAACLAVMDHRRLWLAPLIAAPATWLATFMAVGWCVVCLLG